MGYLRNLSIALLMMAACGCKEDELSSCIDKVLTGRTPIAQARDRRFEGKVSEDAARCRGGEKAAQARNLPWLDWPNYYGTGDQSSRSSSELSDRHGIAGALIDIERERVELIKFNL